MHFLGLYPDAVFARSGGIEINSLQSTASRSTGFGALMFGVVGVVVFGLWAGTGPAMYRWGGEVGAYLVWAAVFMGMAGLGLGRLVVGRDNRLRFLGCFALAFGAYSAVWMAAWFVFPNRTGEVAGAMAGTAVFALILCRAFEAPASWSDTALYLFIGNAAGYFAGDLAHRWLGGDAGKLAWGLLYGLGFGAGIGASLYAVQAEIRRRIREAQVSGIR
jgi:hypothetical protein